MEKQRGTLPVLSCALQRQSWLGVIHIPICNLNKLKWNIFGLLLSYQIESCFFISSVKSTQNTKYLWSYQCFQTPFMLGKGFQSRYCLSLSAKSKEKTQWYQRNSNCMNTIRNTNKRSYRVSILSIKLFTMEKNKMNQQERCMENSKQTHFQRQKLSLSMGKIMGYNSES